MNPRSAHNKGNRFENFLIEVLRKEVDAKSSRTYGSGNGLDKNDIRIPNKNWEIEAKNSATIHLIKDWEQSRRQTTEGNCTALAIRNPKKPEFQETLIVISLEDFINLLNKQGGTSEVKAEFDNSMKWKLQKLIQSAKDVMKEIEI